MSVRMSKVRRLVAALMAAPLLLLAPASGAQASEVLLKETTGNFYVQGWMNTSDECLESGYSVHALADHVAYTQWSWNQCTQESAYVAGTATPSTFAVSKNNTRVRVVASIPLVDLSTWEPHGELLLDNTFTATGKVARTSSNWREIDAGVFTYRTHTNYVVADAAVTGLVPFQAGSITRNATVAITVTPR